MKFFGKRLLIYIAVGLVAWNLPHSNAVMNVKEKAPTPAAAVKSIERKKPKFDFRVAIEAALSLPTDVRQTAVAQVAGHLEVEPIAEDAIWFLTLFLEEGRRGVPGIKRGDWENYLTRFIVQDPIAAAEMLLSQHRIGDRVTEPDGALLMSIWAGLNPRQAIAWGKSGEKERQEWLRTTARELAQGWAAVDLQGLLDYLSKVGAEPDLDATMTALQQQRGKGAAEQWLDQQQENSTLANWVRDGVANFVVRQKLTSENPATVAAWVNQRTQPDEILAGIQSVTMPFLHQDPVSAMNWMEGFSDKPGFPIGIAEAAMGAFASRDLEVAGNWLNAHLDSPLLATYIWGYAVQAALVDMEGALQWVEKLPASGGWGVAGINQVGMTAWQNSMQRMENQMNGGSGREALEYQIRVAGRAGQLWRDPNSVVPEIPARATPFTRYDFPVLVKSSPDADPVLTIKLHPPGTCRPCHAPLPTALPVYVRQKDGSLLLEQSAKQ